MTDWETMSEEWKTVTAEDARKQELQALYKHQCQEIQAYNDIIAGLRRNRRWAMTNAVAMAIVALLQIAILTRPWWGQ